MRRRHFLLLPLLFILMVMPCAASENEYPESAHPYEDGSDVTWTYSCPSSADYLKVSFSEDTILENTFDKLYVTEADGTEHIYSGSMLAGNTIYIRGTSFTLRLTSDSSVHYYGFRITDISPATKAEYEEPRFVVNQGRIVSFSGIASNLIIPSIINGEMITSIGNDVFRDNLSLKSIVVPDTVTQIGTYAFCGCTSLQSVELSDNLSYIGRNAFQDCTELVSIELPETLTSIGSDVFRSCKALPSINVPESLTSIPDSLFHGCSSLDGVVLPTNLTSIGNEAFAYCDSLSSIAIPDTVTTIGYDAFYNCTGLQTVEITKNSSLAKIRFDAFRSCTSLRSIFLPQTLTEIESDLFYQCSSLENAVFSSGFQLTALPTFMFYGCSSLQEISLPESVVSIGYGAFYCCSSLKTIHFGAESVALDEVALEGCNSLTGIEVPITKLGEYALGACNQLVGVEFDDSMGELTDKELSSLKSLMRIVITVGSNSPVYPQLKENGICYIVRETGETNQGNLPVDYLRGKIESIFRTCISEDMSDYEKALALHDWLVKNAEYDYTYTYYGANGVLLNGTGVCASYTSAYAMLLDYAGIENSREYGDDHVWNMIKLDGEWYHIDVTWDDDGSEAEYTYFCVTNEEIEQSSNHECYEKEHIATAYKYNYFYYHGLLDQRIAWVRARIYERINSGEGAFIIASSRRNDTVVLRVLQDEEYAYKGKTLKLDLSRVQIEPVEVEEPLFPCDPDSVDGGFSYNSDTSWYTAGKGISVRVIMDTPNLILPAALKEVGEEAFMGSNMETVKIGEKVDTIGSRAFASCSNLWQIYLPSSVTSIAEDTFEGASVLVIFGEEGSRAEDFALEHGYLFVPESAAQ